MFETTKSFITTFAMRVVQGAGITLCRRPRFLTLIKMKPRKFVSYTFYALFAYAWVDVNDVSNVLIIFLLRLNY